MVSQNERRKLLKEFDHEPAAPYVLLAKCAAGLAIVAGIALIGVYAPTEVEPESGARLPPASAPEVAAAASAAQGVRP